MAKKKPAPRKVMPYTEMSAMHEKMETSKSPRKKSSKAGKSKIGY